MFYTNVCSKDSCWSLNIFHSFSEVNPHSKYKNTVAQFQTIPSLWLEKISKKFLSCLKARVKNSRPFFSTNTLGISKN